jgi:formylglycine-generating enzyme required for sulfatase activity
VSGRRPPLCAIALLLAHFVVASCKKAEPTDIDGMVVVPAGGFRMGSRGSVERHGMDEGDGSVGIDIGVDELPMHAVNLPGYYIDRHEVTNREYERFIEATGHRLPDNTAHPNDPFIWKGGTYPEDLGDYPVALVSHEDAATYCAWAGKRLPTEEEWEKACRGSESRRWPWGDAFDVSNANMRELDLKRSSPVGGFPKDVSPYGAYDMAGNVREWTSSWYGAYPGSTLVREMFGEKYRVIRGGSWLHLSNPESRCASRGAALPEARHRSLGFRCAKDAG